MYDGRAMGMHIGSMPEMLLMELNEFLAWTDVILDRSRDFASDMAVRPTRPARTISRPMAAFSAAMQVISSTYLGSIAYPGKRLTLPPPKLR